MRTYNTISEIKAHNKQIGNHFFDRSTMAFFNSRILTRVFRGIYFVTSEQFDENSPRLYTIRACLNGSIETVGKFQGFKTGTDAMAFINSFPAYLPDAMNNAIEAFNAGKMAEFIGHATLEQNNDKNGNYSLDSFCGACAWLFEHCEELDFSACKSWLKDYKEALKETA